MSWRTPDEGVLTVPGWLEKVRQLMSRRLDMALYVTEDPGRVERDLDRCVRYLMVWCRIGEEFQRHVGKRSREVLLIEMLGAAGLPGKPADLAADGVRSYAIPYEAEVVSRSPRLVIGKGSDL